MISMINFKKIVHYLHLEELFDSIKEFHKDNRGGFLIPATAKIMDPEYERYRHLPINWSISPLTEDDLPDEFSPLAVKTVDIFRRKTFNLPNECMLLFDYITGNIISCNFSDDFDRDKVETEVFPDVLKSMHIASIHNHPDNYCSPPSGKNFQMLGFDFEEFELISARNELWILKSNEVIFDDEEIEEIRIKANCYFEACFEILNCDFEKGYLLINNLNKCYGDKLLSYINKKSNIVLTRRYLND